jgi:hypothetical protein
VKWIKPSSASDSPLVPRIAPVVCMSCGSAAHLIRRAPHSQLGARVERRTFECSACLELTAITVEHGLSDCREAEPLAASAAGRGRQ